MAKRLFLFAAYDNRNSIGSALVMYIKALSVLGDVVLYMDNEMPQQQDVEKIENYIKAFGAERHGEYDFGSYKRAYKLATKTLNVSDYDYLYLVNDSVYGPLYPLNNYLERMEKFGGTAFGLVYNPHRKRPHLQSWFMGFDKDVFLATYFDNFMAGIQKETDKNAVCIKYEIGLSNLLSEHGIKPYALYVAKAKQIYNNVYGLYKKGLPFIKKSAITRHNGSLCLQVKKVLNNCDDYTKNILIEDITARYGSTYTDSILNANHFNSTIRYLKYLSGKIADTLK